MSPFATERDGLRAEILEQVGVLTLTRPETMNAVSPELARALRCAGGNVQSGRVRRWYVGAAAAALFGLVLAAGLVLTAAALGGRGSGLLGAAAVLGGHGRDHGRRGSRAARGWLPAPGRARAGGTGGAHPG